MAFDRNVPIDQERVIMAIFHKLGPEMVFCYGPEFRRVLGQAAESNPCALGKYGPHPQNGDYSVLDTLISKCIEDGKLVSDNGGKPYLRISPFVANAYGAMIYYNLDPSVQAIVMDVADQLRGAFPSI